MAFSYRDLVALQDLASARWVTHPIHPKLDGKVLTPTELRALSLFEAAVILLNRQGANVPDGLGRVRFDNPEVRNADAE